MLLGRCGEMCYLNKLLMLSVLGWLFQVKQLFYFFGKQNKSTALSLFFGLQLYYFSVTD